MILSLSLSLSLRLCSVPAGRAILDSEGNYKEIQARFFTDTVSAHDLAMEGETAIKSVVDGFRLKALKRPGQTSRGEMTLAFDTADATGLRPTTAFALIQLIWGVAHCCGLPPDQRPWVFLKGASKKAHSITYVLLQVVVRACFLFEVLFYCAPFHECVRACVRVCVRACVACCRSWIEPIQPYIDTQGDSSKPLRGLEDWLEKVFLERLGRFMPFARHTYSLNPPFDGCTLSSLFSLSGPEAVRHGQALPMAAEHIRRLERNAVSESEPSSVDANNQTAAQQRLPSARLALETSERNGQPLHYSLGAAWQQPASTSSSSSSIWNPADVCTLMALSPTLPPTVKSSMQPSVDVHAVQTSLRECGLSDARERDALFRYLLAHESYTLCAQISGQNGAALEGVEKLLHLQTAVRLAYTRTTYLRTMSVCVCMLVVCMRVCVRACERVRVHIYGRQMCAHSLARVFVCCVVLCCSGSS